MPCCAPRGCPLGSIRPHNPDPDCVLVLCSNDKCPYGRYMHGECFEAFEEQVLSCLRGMSRARGWNEKQRRQNLWHKKGYDLVYKFCTCPCGKGNLRRDMSHVSQDAVATSSSSGVAVDRKKRRKKSSSLSEKSPRDVARPRSIKNSDSMSSDNGSGHMQPFAHRTDYSVFDKLVPRGMVNSYHIKMEDDGYAAGDETRSFVLSSMAFHRTCRISCVLCDEQLVVYDRFPLLNGTFYLSPVRPCPSALEVEGKGDDPLFLSAVCLSCLVGRNQVKCSHCHKNWDGTAHQIGTMYTYDLFAATPCCPTCVQCTSCDHPLLDVTNLTCSFSKLSTILECPRCSTKAYHCIKPLSRMLVTRLVQDPQALQ